MGSENENHSYPENSVFSGSFLAAIRKSAYEGTLAALTAANAGKLTPEKSENDEHLNYEAAAEYLGVTKQTVSVYKRRGVFPYYQTGRTVYFKKSEIDAALASKKKGVPQ